MITAAICNRESELKRSTVPTELLCAGLLRQHGFPDVRAESICRRNSNKELFEFVVSGRFFG